jgi:hypothetical protein
MAGKFYCVFSMRRAGDFRVASEDRTLFGPKLPFPLA